MYVCMYIYTHKYFLNIPTPMTWVSCFIQGPKISLCACRCVYIRMYIYTYIYTHIQIYIHISYICMFEYLCFDSVRFEVCMHIVMLSTYPALPAHATTMSACCRALTISASLVRECTICIYVCIYVCVCLFVCMYVCMYGPHHIRFACA